MCACDDGSRYWKGVGPSHWTRFSQVCVRRTQRWLVMSETVIIWWCSGWTVRSVPCRYQTVWYAVWYLAILLNDVCRSQWPRSLRRRSAATCLLRSWVRIPWGHGCMSVVSVVCCQVEVSAMSWWLVQRSPTECGLSSCVIKTLRERGGQGPLGGLSCQKKKSSRRRPHWISVVKCHYLCVIYSILCCSITWSLSCCSQFLIGL